MIDEEKLATWAKASSISDGAFRTLVAIMLLKETTLLKLRAFTKSHSTTRHVRTLERAKLIRTNNGVLTIAEGTRFDRKENPSIIVDSCTKYEKNKGDAKNRTDSSDIQEVADASHLQLGDSPDIVNAWKYGPSPKKVAIDSFNREIRPSKEWSSIVILGLYLHEYERWSRRRWEGSRMQLFTLHRLVDGLVKSYGSAEAVLIVRMLHTKPFDWVSSKLAFANNRDNYTKFLVPELVKAKKTGKKKGEQAEWRKKRTESGSKKVTL